MNPFSVIGLSSRWGQMTRFTCAQWAFRHRSLRLRIVPRAFLGNLTPVARLLQHRVQHWSPYYGAALSLPASMSPGRMQQRFDAAWHTVSLLERTDSLARR